MKQLLSLLFNYKTVSDGVLEAPFRGLGGILLLSAAFLFAACADEYVPAVYPTLGDALNNLPVMDTKPTPAEDGAVDLGLSVLWADCNLGGDTPDANGDFLAWGSLEPTSTYTQESSQWANRYVVDLRREGVIDANGNLTPAYDAATQRLGADWHIPTVEEWQELMTKCTWKWVKYNGVNSMLITGPNGNCIVLRPAGLYNKEGWKSHYVYGGYWTSTVYPEWNIYSYNVAFDVNTLKPKEDVEEEVEEDVENVEGEIEEEADTLKPEEGVNALFYSARYLGRSIRPVRVRPYVPEEPETPVEPAEPSDPSPSVEPEEPQPAE